MLHEKESRKHPPVRKQMIHNVKRNSFGKPGPQRINHRTPTIVIKRRQKQYRNHKSQSHIDSSRGKAFRVPNHRSRGSNFSPSRIDRTHSQTKRGMNDHNSHLESSTGKEGLNKTVSTPRHPWLHYRENEGDGNASYDNNGCKDSYLPSFRSENPNCKNINSLPLLDPKNSDHAHKIVKRRKMISYGKNTIGYDEYLKKIPKHRRIPRCPDHPTTPDSTVDIPWKRFHGLVKAW